MIWDRALNWADSFTRWALVLLLRVYQIAISPVLRPSCRYEPSCSQYAIDAISRHGTGHGCALAAKRLVRCHPLGASGYDPVP